MTDAIRAVRDLNEVETVLLEALNIAPPATKFKPGDLAQLVFAPQQLQMRRTEVPAIWQVRFVASEWTREAFMTAMRLYHEGTWEDYLFHYNYDILRMMQEIVDLPAWRHHRPWVYAHGHPHALHPNSAAWFREKHLARIFCRGATVEWPEILDAAHTEYEGWNAPVGLTLDMAPERYGRGIEFKNPFAFEETSYDMMCRLGYEAAMHSRVDPRYYTLSLPEVDPYTGIPSR